MQKGFAQLSLLIIPVVIIVIAAIVFLNFPHKNSNYTPLKNTQLTNSSQDNCGNDIGKFSFVGAGAVVTKEVQDYTLVVGNPSKQIGWVSEYGHRLKFNDNGIGKCIESNQEYLLENNKVKRII